MLQEESRGVPKTLPIVALGSNERDQFGGARAIVKQAIAALGRADLPVVAQSRLYATPCFPAGSGPDFVNAVVQVDSRLSPEALLARLHALEAEFRRVREKRWGPRTLDLDLLAMGDMVLPDETTQRHWANLPLARQMEEAPARLILPHPRLQDRAFVLIPMADIAPNWRHPVTGNTVTGMLAALPAAEKAAIVPIEPG